MRWLPALLIGFVLASCAAALTAGEYGDAVQDLGRDYEQETTELQRTLHEELQGEIEALGRGLDEEDPEAVAGYAEQVVALTATRTRAFFAAVGDSLHRYRTLLAELAPPSVVAGEHRELLAAMDGVLAGLPDLLSGLEAAGDFDAIDDAVYGSGFTDAGPRLAAACRSLAEALGDEAIAVDLRCPS
ncbi:MAG: hypothetical protein EHM57_00735 [Actinobacteria bacterium]|nr:MAG: hypothetical protein EHM57_00735 [Actinomycetota bacterium]